MERSTRRKSERQGRQSGTGNCGYNIFLVQQFDMRMTF